MLLLTRQDVIDACHTKPQIKCTRFAPGPRQNQIKFYPTHAYVGFQKFELYANSR